LAQAIGMGAERFGLKHKFNWSNLTQEKCLTLSLEFKKEKMMIIGFKEHAKTPLAV
jgi:hypothetical protein